MIVFVSELLISLYTHSMIVFVSTSDQPVHSMIVFVRATLIRTQTIQYICDREADQPAYITIYICERHADPPAHSMIY